MAKPKIERDGPTITVRVPIAIRKRGGRKVVLAPDGTSVDANKLLCQQPDNAMVKALARAFRWREMLESGSYSTVKDIADTERINESYISRMLRLTLLAPDIIEKIVEGRQSPTTTLAALMRQLPVRWDQQRANVCFQSQS